jgi:hypothetical protein
MKQIILFTAPIILLGTVSCKKEIYGCTDALAVNHSTYATVDDGSCYYYTAPTEEVLMSNIIYGVSWSQGSTWWYIELTWSEITQSVLDNGAVSVYMKAGGDWIELPFTTYLSSSYSSSINAFYSLGKVTIEWSDSDGTLPLEPDPYDFKVVIFK